MPVEGILTQAVARQAEPAEVCNFYRVSFLHGFALALPYLDSAAGLTTGYYSFCYVVITSGKKAPA